MLPMCHTVFFMELLSSAKSSIACDSFNNRDVTDADNRESAGFLEGAMESQHIDFRGVLRKMGS